MKYSIGQRIIVTEPEYEDWVIAEHAAIPVGTTGTVVFVHNDLAEYPPTGELSYWLDILFDLPFEENTNWINKDGMAQWQLMAAMVQPFEDSSDEWSSEINLEGFLHSSVKI